MSTTHLSSRVFFFQWYGDLRDLHSFPTRRSSDLGRAAHLAQHLAPVVELQALAVGEDAEMGIRARRSEEHTSELQSLRHLVCRLLLEKKKVRAEAIFRTRQAQRCPLHLPQQHRRS